MNRKGLALLLLLALGACRHPDIEYLDFETFKVLSVNYSHVVQNGNLNPEVALMGDTDLDGDPDTKVASTQAVTLVRDLLGSIHSRNLVHIAGQFEGHDIDGAPMKQSGKLVLPESGPIKNIILVSHYTIGANFECPSQTFPLEALFADKGYAVVIADYIGFGTTADRIHPYMHTESTARSVVDMALAVKPYLKYIGREPESDEVILFGYSQGGSTTLAVMDILQDEYPEFPIKQVYAGGGPYDLAATFDYSMEVGVTGIPCAIPMIVQGVNEGERLGLNMESFFKERLLEHYNDWINSKKYTVKEINRQIASRDLRDIMTEAGRDRSSGETALLYKALLKNSTLNFIPRAPIYLFHSRTDQTVPFVNAEHAEAYFKGRDIRYDFGDYGKHALGCIRFILTAYKDLP